MAGKQAKDFAQRLTMQLGNLKTQRAPFDDVWQKVAVFESEHMTMFSGTRSPSHEMDFRRDPRDVDNTVRHAVTVFSSGMLSGVSPPSDQWFQFRVSDDTGGEALGKLRPVAAWLEEVERVVARDFTAKNFYTQQVSSYKNIAMYGMQAMFVGYHDDIGTYYRDIPPDEIYIENDFAGRVNLVFREMKLPLHIVINLFGKENLSPALRTMIENRDCDQFTEITIVHAVVKKEPGYQNIVGANRLPYASYYFEPGEDHLISEGGFETLPYIVTRAYSHGRSPYSISPGTVALADVLMVNEIKKLLLQAGQLSVAPPMLMPDRGLVGRMNYTPYAVNLYRKDQTTDRADFGPLEIPGEFNLAMELLQMAQKDINSAFFVDLFLMIHNRVQQGKGTPTAMEVEQLAMEKSFLLAPILINQQQENFNRLFERIIELKKHETGALPPVPRELAEARIDIDYISPLVRAQQGVKTQQMLQGLQDMGMIAGLYPDIGDIIDIDGIAREILENRGMPQSKIRTIEEVAQIRERKAQMQQAAQQQAQQAQMLQGALDGYQGLAKAPEQGSPMQQLIGGAA